MHHEVKPTAAAQLTLLLVCLALVTSNIYMLVANRRLRTTLAIAKSGSAPRVGSVLKGVLGYDLDDQIVRVEFKGSKDPTLVLLFSPVCHYCEENWPQWRRLLSKHHGRVILADITGDVTREYLNSLQLPDTLLKSPNMVIKLDPDMKAIYDLRVTPTTIAVGCRGEVKGSWIGPLKNDDMSSIESMLQPCK